jgi:hypothetical protein
VIIDFRFAFIRLIRGKIILFAGISFFAFFVVDLSFPGTSVFVCKSEISGSEQAARLTVRKKTSDAPAALTAGARGAREAAALKKPLTGRAGAGYNRR